MVAPVSSPKIWYPEGYPGPAYNLSYVLDWCDDVSDELYLIVQFVGWYNQPVRFVKSDFLAAYDAYASS